MRISGKSVMEEKRREGIPFQSMPDASIPEDWACESKTILIVDDEPELLTILEKRLTSFGYKVIKAKDGKSGFSMAKEEKPDLVILDMLMPDMDGDEVAEQLRECTETHEIPIIFLSCILTNQEENQHSYLLGDHVFMGKPYDPQKLLKTIEALI